MMATSTDEKRKQQTQKEVRVESEDEKAHNGLGTGDTPESKGEWTKLMGDELVVKKIGPIEEDQSSPSNEKEEKYAEMGDVVFIDFIGRTFPSADDTSKSKPMNSYNNLSEYPMINFFGNNLKASRSTNTTKHSSGKTIFVNVKDCLVTMGDGDVVPALEMGIRFIPINHYGIVRAHPKYAFGSTGYLTNKKNNDIGKKSFEYKDHPPDSAVEFHVVIKSHISSNSDLFRSSEFKVKRANAKKEMGNNAFQFERNFVRSLKLYQSSAQILNDILHEPQASSTDDEYDLFVNNSNEARGLLVDCYNNSALIYYKTGEYKKSKDMASVVLKDWDPDNTRALCRAAKASMMDPNGTFEESKAAIDAAIELMGEDNKDVIKLLLEWKRRKRDYKKMEKKMFYSKIKGTHGIGEHNRLGKQEKKELEPSWITIINAKVFPVIAALSISSIVLIIAILRL